MRTELVSIATDTLPLDGALHVPEGRPVAGAVLLFHGNTMNFYVGAPRFLPPVLTRLGLVVSRVQPPRPRYSEHSRQPRRRGRRVPAHKRGHRGQPLRRRLDGRARLSRPGRDRPQQWRHARRQARRRPSEHAGNGAAVGAWRRDRRRRAQFARRADGRRPARRDHRAGARAGRRGPRPRTDADAGLVVRDQRREFSRPPDRDARRARTGAGDKLPDAVRPRRPGRLRELPGRTLPRPLGRNVRCRDRARLRPFLCRARGRDLRLVAGWLARTLGLHQP